MKILIIGSKGFIGTHALKFLTAIKAYNCYGADVVVDYTSSNYILLDAVNSNFNEIFEEHKFDVCINCSGAASVPDSLINPLRDFTLNSFNVIRILDAIRKYSPGCKFLNLSSAAVYGNPHKLPLRESDPINPVSPYGFHKWYAEKICHEYHQQFGLYTCSLRIFSAFGPGLKKQLLWDTAQKVLGSGTEVLQLYGTGEETRDFIYIDDLIRALHVVLVSGSFNAETYNIANGVQIKIRTVAETIVNKLRPGIKIVFSGTNRIGDPLYWEADISKILSLGYQQQVSLEAGVDKYIQWLNEEKLG